MNVLGVRIQPIPGTDTVPHLALLLDAAPEPPPGERRFVGLEVGEWRLWIARYAPLADFLVEPLRGGPELFRRPLRLATREGVYVCRGWWSSSPRAVNAWRREYPAVAAALPHDVVDATWRVGSWVAQEHAGLGWDLPFVLAVLDRFGLDRREIAA